MAAQLKTLPPAEIGISSGCSWAIGLGSHKYFKLYLQWPVLLLILFFHISGGLLTPIPTPTNVSPTATQDPTAKPPVAKIPTPLPLPLVTTGTITPDSSPLGVLSPAATTAAVSMAMNGAKRALSASQAPTDGNEEPDIKRQKLLQQGATWHGTQQDNAEQEKL